MGTPAYYKDNPATRAFERVQQLRSELGSRADRGLPSAALDMPIPPDMRNVPIGEDGNPLPMISPLSQQEIAERNEAWERETGQKFDSLNNVTRPGSNDEEDIPAYDPGEAKQRTPALANGGIYRWPAQGAIMPQGPRNIDFSKMQSINPVEGTVVVDGISFNMNASEKQSSAVLMANIVQRAMQDQLLAGLKSLGLVETPDAPATAMPSLSEEGAGVATPTDDVLPGQEQDARTSDLL